eukprot:170811-Chlamydomonas_euryale.AAC.1
MVPPPPLRWCPCRRCHAGGQGGRHYEHGHASGDPGGRGQGRRAPGVEQCKCARGTASPAPIRRTWA